MDTNVARIIVIMVLIFIVLIGLRRWSLYRETSKVKQFGITFAVLFVALTIFYMIWPYE